MRFLLGSTVIEIDLWVVILILILIVVFIIISVNRGIIAHRFKIAAGSEELVGRTAEVKIALKPKGFVFVDGERWSAITEDDNIEEEEQVTITGVDGLTLHVTRKK